MRFVLTINCDNAAFAPTAYQEVARLLRDAAETVNPPLYRRRQGELRSDGGTLRDADGNTVGHFGFMEGGDDATR